MQAMVNPLGGLAQALRSFGATAGGVLPSFREAADGLDEEAQRIVREIFDNAHDVMRAEDELELRARPN
jgi:hypothetical protein